MGKRRECIRYSVTNEVDEPKDSERSARMCLSDWVCGNFLGGFLVLCRPLANSTQEHITFQFSLQLALWLGQLQVAILQYLSLVNKRPP